MARLTFGGREIPRSQNAEQSLSYSDLGAASEDIGVNIEECDVTDVVQERPTTRIVLQTSTFPPNNGIEDFNIAGYLCHARRSPKKSSEEWESVANFDLRRMKAGEYVRIELGPNNLKALFLALAAKYQELGGLESILSEAGVKAVDPDHATIIEGKERETLQVLMERDEDFWDNAAELDTRNALETKALQLEHQRRKEALLLFKEHLDTHDWSEGEWEIFFKDNEWIFGLGLTYHFLGTVQHQAVLGGTDITGRGTDKVDYMMATLGDTRFTVLVDIKRPDTKLLHDRPYRSNIYRVDKEVAGGVAQLQSYCYTWSTEGVQRNGQPERLGAYTYEPKGMLIVGDLAELVDSDEKKKSFELFRRHIHNPQILTFDEIYSRAEYVVTRYEKAQFVTGETDDDRDVPF